MTAVWGPEGWRAWMSRVAMLIVLGLAVMMLVAASVTRDPVVAAGALLAIGLVLGVSRPWVIIARGKLWRSPTFGRPLSIERLSEVRWNRSRLEVQVEDRWVPVAISPYGLPDRDSNARNEQRLRDLLGI